MDCCGLRICKDLYGSVKVNKYVHEYVQQFSIYNYIIDVLDKSPSTDGSSRLKLDYGNYRPKLPVVKYLLKTI